MAGSLRQASVEGLLLYGCHELADLAPIEKLIGLEHLSLIGCRKGLDLAPLRKLPRLRVIEMR